MKTLLVLSFLISGSAFADQAQTSAPSSASAPVSVTTTYAMRCDTIEVDQFIDKDGKAQDPSVSKSRVVGTQVSTKTGNVERAVTNGSNFSSDAGSPEILSSSYASNRKTTTYQLAANKVREVSDIQMHSVLPGDRKFEDGTNSKDSVEHTTNDYLIQADGSRKLVASYLSGRQLELGAEVDYDMIDSDGTKTSVSQNDQPEDSPTNDGGTFRELQFKSICTFTAKQ